MDPVFLTSGLLILNMAPWCWGVHRSRGCAVGGGQAQGWAGMGSLTTARVRAGGRAWPKPTKILQAPPARALYRGRLAG